jgi:branched-chain amino acid transport system ATP-binding protein
VSLIGKLRQQGITIILVEHNMKAVLNATQRLIVLNFGHKIADGRPEHVVDMNEVIECYLGTEVI